MAKTAPILLNAMQQIEAALAAAIGSGAKLFEQKLRSKTPSDRRKTRRYTTSIHRPGELKAAAGVVFPPGSRFDTGGTYTRKLVDRVYRSESGTILSHIADQVSQSIDRQPQTHIEIRKG